MTIDQGIVLIYLLSLFVMAFISATRIHTMEDYAVAGRAYPAWVVYATLAASVVGGGFAIGNAEKIHEYGLVFVLAVMGVGVREILVALFVAPKMDHFRDCLSIGDIMRHAYGTPAKVITGLFATFLCAGSLGAQVGALGYIFSAFLNIEPLVGILLGCGIVILYVTIGGFKAVVWTDIIQFAILIIALPLTAFLAVKAAGGLEQIAHTVPSDRFDLFSHYTPFAFLSIAMFYLMGEALAPPYIQRLLVGKNAKAVIKGALWSGLTILPLALIIGLLTFSTLAIDPSVPANEVMTFIIDTVLPIGVTGFVIAAMIAVIMSSADSFLNAAAVCMVHDVIKPLTNDNLQNHTELRFTQLITLLVGVSSVFFALSYENLVDGLLKVYGVWAPVIVIPLVAAARGFKASTKTFLFITGSGFIASVLWDYWLGVDNLVSGILVGVVAALAAFIVVYLKEYLTPAR